MMPLFWFDFKVELDDENVKLVNFAIHLRKYGSIFAYSLLGLGVAVISLAFVLTVTNKWKCSHRDDEEPIIFDHSVTNLEGLARES